MPRIILRRGLESARSTEVPLSGELVYTTDEKKVYVGDGVTAGGNPLIREYLDIIQQQGIELTSTGSNNLVTPDLGKALMIYRLDITTATALGLTKVYLGTSLLYEFLMLKPGGMYGGNFALAPIPGEVDDALSILLPALATICVNVSWKEV
jgi:hypothetical protein